VGVTIEAQVNQLLQLIQGVKVALQAVMVVTQQVAPAPFKALHLLALKMMQHLV
jgi:hypothetical protein